MKIPEKTWKTYLERLSRIDKTATSKMIAYMNKVPEALQNDPAALVEYAYGISTKYGEAAAALACEMYDAVAEASGASILPAVPADTAEYGEVAKTVYGTRKTGNPDIVASSIGRLVKRTGADTTIKNAIRDAAEWAWIPNGDTCAFCLTLASGGWQEASSKTLKGDHAEHIHANCDCSFQIRFDRNTEYAGYDPDQYLEMYENAEGKTPEEKINSLRRARYAKNKDKINAQKREAYKEKKERLQGNKHADTITGMSEKDITEEWIKRSKEMIPSVIDNITSVNIEGKMYVVDGRNVMIDHDDKERETAKLLSQATGKKVTLCPRICGHYEGVHTPDYILDNTEKWDRKGLTGAGKDAVRDCIKKKEKQADHFIIDISEWKGTEENIIQQMDRVFHSGNTRFVKTLAVIRNDEIIRVIER